MNSKENINEPEVPKKVVIPAKVVKPKRGQFSKKLKLNKSFSQSETIGNRVDLPTTSKSFDVGNDDEIHSISKSISETNLIEGISENFEDKRSSTESVTNESQAGKSVDRKNSLTRTKSLENIKKMTAYGELIIDSTTLPMSNANQSITQKPKDHLYKILVIGDLGTGKTSIIKRYVHRFFTQHYRATIGVDFALKVLNWDDNTHIRLQLWDIAGQERYGNMTRVYYKEAVGAFIVFDVTRRTTFQSVANWKLDLDSKVQLPDGSSIPCVLLANKCDQQKEGIVNNPTKMDEYCAENKFTAWFETSARDNINIDEAAKALVQKILWYDTILNNDKKTGEFSLTNNSNGQKKDSSCSC